MMLLPLPQDFRYLTDWLVSDTPLQGPLSQFNSRGRNKTSSVIRSHRTGPFSTQEIGFLLHFCNMTSPTSIILSRLTTSPSLHREWYLPSPVRRRKVSIVLWRSRNPVPCVEKGPVLWCRPSSHPGPSQSKQIPQTATFQDGYPPHYHPSTGTGPLILGPQPPRHILSYFHILCPRTIPPVHHGH